MDRVPRRPQAAYTEQHVASVLGSAGIDIVAEVPSDFIIFCPYHNNHRTPAGEVSKESGVFYCFGCHTVASLADLVMHTTGKTYFEVLRMVGNPPLDLDATVKKMNVKEQYEPFDQALIDRFKKDMSPYAIEYFNSRGIYDLDTFELGYSIPRDMVIVPVHAPDGMLVGFQGRSIDGKDYKNSTDLPKRKLLFNLHRVRTSPYVYLLESPMDVIRCHQLGIPAVSSFGSGVTKEQIDLLFRYFPEVYVVPDRDDAGRKMALTLMDKGAILVVVPEGANDVGDLNDEEIKTLLDRSNLLAGLL